MTRSNLEILELAALLAGPSDVPPGITLEYEDIVRLVVSLAGAITQLPITKAIDQNNRVAILAPDQVTEDNLAEVQERLGRDRSMLEAAQHLKDVSIEIVASNYARKHWAGL